ncbi:flagellar type III secretion system pore protein FliP [Sandaracinobacteroides saxicola]|uniref:Flagellar biosynthetic protein FliP n=1 Tax=Sandaracinobacteroides saxicola TaxID=2759707 RepID=A0A7G5IK09_9SPHN|nr:flagellar type III secretion system pore protein FliP [Sandaracinobacteroides saxicola]QMW23701.1 flagellar type III secretion system pore protein FliP [Sandaracinobacteroides saxicola]
MRRMIIIAAAPVMLLLLGAAAPAPSAGSGPSLTGSAMSLIVALTVLSLAPAILMTITSFVRIVVALSLLRTGFGAPGVPPNMVIVALALFLTLFVMKPTFDIAWTQGAAPYLAGSLTEAEAFKRTIEPFRTFMLANTREGDMRLFIDMAGTTPQSRADIDLRTLIPAFLISELKRAFEIGFLLLLPFLVIDLVVASVLMALGLMMLPPATISLPAKLIFFVLVDGWALVVSSLVRSYAGMG